MKTPRALRHLSLCLALTAAVLLPGTAWAQLAVPETRILPSELAASPLKVTPDRADWTYVRGAAANFRITLDLSPYPAEGVTIRYKLGPEMLEGAEKTAVVPASGLVLPVTAPSEPGFVRCSVTAMLEGKPVTALATIGYAPELIKPTQTEPADFDAFWDKQKAALAKIEPDYRLEPAPDQSSATVEAFYFSFQNVGGWSGPSRIYGVLCVPRRAGTFPAVLSVPGAGVRPYSGNRGMAEKGVITLQIGIHGIPVNMPKEVYDNLGRGALDNYNRFNLDNRDAYYYRRVYLGCLRAADYLTTHPKWDGKNLVVMGGSQGGQLTIMTAALEPRVTALAASYPAYSDVTGYLHGRAGGWPGLFRPTAAGGVNDTPVEPKKLTTQYYDTLNFARRIRVPGMYFQGYNDVVCPATSVFAVYNLITAPKKLLLALEQGHAITPTQQAPINDWVYERIGLH